METVNLETLRKYVESMDDNIVILIEFAETGDDENE